MDFLMKKDGQVASLFSACSHFIIKKTRLDPTIDLTQIPYSILIDMLMAGFPQKFEFSKLRFPRENVVFPETEQVLPIGKTLVPFEYVNQIYKERTVPHDQRLFWKYICQETENENGGALEYSGVVIPDPLDIYTARDLVFCVFGYGIERFTQAFDANPKAKVGKEFITFCEFMDDLIVDLCQAVGIVVFTLDVTDPNSVPAFGSNTKRSIKEMSKIDKIHHGIFMLMVTLTSLLLERKLQENDAPFKRCNFDRMIASRFFNKISDLVLQNGNDTIDIFSSFKRYYVKHQLPFFDEIVD